jgi:hypothetical protein
MSTSAWVTASRHIFQAGQISYPRQSIRSFTAVRMCNNGKVCWITRKSSGDDLAILASVNAIDPGELQQSWFKVNLVPRNFK